MADETEFTRQRVHDDFNASNEAARAAAQAAILINGGAATALLAFLSKATPPPPFLVRAARVSLGLYALGLHAVRCPRGTQHRLRAGLAVPGLGS
jgi:hypothetical protein